MSSLHVTAEMREPSGMKWSTAVGHLRRLAEQCALQSQANASLGLRVTQLWAVGEVLHGPRDLDWVTAAVCVDLPVADVPWMCPPPGADYWADLTRASKNPVALWWRSSRAPVWNHRIESPVLVWDDSDGVNDEAFGALMSGRSGSMSMPPPTSEEFQARMDDELRTSLAELRRRTAEYATEHTTRLGVRGDRLHAAAQGYLDVLAVAQGQELD